MKKSIVFTYSLIHFVVDLACCILVTNFVSQKMGQNINFFWAVIIYNFFAFAMQLPVGIIADRLNKNALLAATGCLLVGLGYFLTNYGILACIIAGMGNSMFHVGGGIDVLNISDKKATLSGIFVSTGAMGIFLGAKTLSIGFSEYGSIVVMLGISAFLLIWLYNLIKDQVKNDKIVIKELNLKEMISVICLVITVCIRSYVGMILAFDWKNSFILALISTLAVVCGKMLGGIIGDKIGFEKISLISLGISAILFIFSFKSSVLGILAILLFNMTMPITLTALSNLLINKGMAFGLLTVALFIGSVPVFFGFNKLIFSPAGLFGITIISAIILGIGIKEYNEVTETKNA